MASSSKALGELLRLPKRLRPISLSPQSMTLKSPISTLHAPPLAAGEHPSALTSEQVKRAKRVDAGRSLSRWKRNLSICSERIATRKGTHSDPYVKLGELLVEETWLEALPGQLQKPYAQNLCRMIAYAACLEGSDPVRLFDKRVNAKREPGYVFDKVVLLQYNHMSFGGAPVEVETEEEAEELMLQNDKDSANGNQLNRLIIVKTLWLVIYAFGKLKIKCKCEFVTRDERFFVSPTPPDDYDIHMLCKLMPVKVLGGRYSEEDAKAIVIQILSVIAFCHLQGVVHRDLKPEEQLRFTNLKYSRVEIDEVRFEWAECMLDYI
ncbi:hypothetical protein ZIOFF_050761 [Zingiber officinale]|uniref:Protein kinase domain-containing protein n=1 Tax=Zingiber officinale TaxID=94328 RepID=A0A8J5FJF9_ZINOF|nr:hypothetical protein ZIOFF_050761 [Zingiber officinale]